MNEPMFDSLERMARLSRRSVIVAVAGYAFGVIAWPIGLEYAAPCIVIGTTGVLIALFTGFRAEHLEQVERERAAGRMK